MYYVEFVAGKLVQDSTQLFCSPPYPLQVILMQTLHHLGSEIMKPKGIKGCHLHKAFLRYHDPENCWC